MLVKRRVLVACVFIAAVGALLLVAPAPRPRPSDGLAATIRVTTLRGGMLQEPNIVLVRGDRLLRRVTADRAMRLRLEGYEVVRTLRPDQPTDFPIDAWAPGVFALQDADTGAKVGILIVQERPRP